MSTELRVAIWFTRSSTFLRYLISGSGCSPISRLDVRIYLALLLSSVSVSVSANKLDAHKINSQLSPAVVSSVPGQWTLLQLWTLDCAVCEKQKPRLSEINNDYNELTVMGLSLDGLDYADDVRARLVSKKHSFVNYIAELSSVKSQLQNLFNSEYIGTPTYILFSPAGKVVAVQPGPIDLRNLPKQLELKKTSALTPKAPSPDLIR